MACSVIADTHWALDDVPSGEGDAHITPFERLGDSPFHTFSIGFQAHPPFVGIVRPACFEVCTALMKNTLPIAGDDPRGIDPGRFEQSIGGDVGGSHSDHGDADSFDVFPDQVQGIQ
jgi:hypothetical protein